MILCVTMHESVHGTDSANSRALVAVVALCKRLLNASFSTSSDSKCRLGGERRTETVVKASSSVTCWLNIAIAVYKCVNSMVGGKAHEREILAEAM